MNNMLDNFKKETSDLYRFLKGHSGIKQVDINKEDTAITLNVTIGDHEAVNWKLIQNIFEQHFETRYKYNLKINYTNLFPPDLLAEEDDDDDGGLVIVQRAKPVPQPIIVYSTDKNDWRLFRFYSQSKKAENKNYFDPDPDIAKKEISNLEDAYHHILSDMKQKTFTRNIIELNINCLNSNDLKDLYIDALRKLPAQLKSRMAISMVRIPPNASIHILRQAALICKLCTDNIFLSLQYSPEISKQKLGQIYGVSGYIITVPAEDTEKFEDVMKVYDRLNAAFGDKKTFVIFNNDNSKKNNYKSSKIMTLKEREKIGVKTE